MPDVTAVQSEDLNMNVRKANIQDGAAGETSF